jgi:ABC-2 type transport system permease protein
MLAIFQIINGSMQSDTQSDAQIFNLTSLTPGIAIFSFSFVMLYMAMLISKDKKTSFLLRLFSAPLTASDFLLGYAIPGLVIALMQEIICFSASLIIAFATGQTVDILGYLCSIITLFPTSIIFIAMGMFFGTVFSEKAAPGISSLFISVSGMVSGAWMPLEQMKTFGKICRFLPFYPAVRVGREAMSLWSGVYNTFLLDAAIVIAYAVVLSLLAVYAFKARMRKDK